MKKEKSLDYIFLMILAAAIILADRLTKIFAQGVEINKGAAFGILQGQTILFIIISLLIILMIFLFYRKAGRTMQIALALILAGTISNAIDRIFLGYVIDFIRIPFISNSSSFNLADISNVTGAVILLVSLFRKK
jgi:signal peptidase II